MMFVDEDAPTIVTIAMTEPLGGRDTTAPRDARYLEHLAVEMLNRRLVRAAAQPSPPFASANVASYVQFSTAHLRRLEIIAYERDWEKALRAGARELRRALAEGFSAAEFEEQMAVSRAALGGASAPRSSTALADAIVDAVGRDIVFTEPGDPAQTSAYLAGVELQAVNAAFRSAWGRQRPSIFVSHNRRMPDAEAVMERLWSGGE
jgi:zinc protease